MTYLALHAVGRAVNSHSNDRFRRKVSGRWRGALDAGIVEVSYYQLLLNMTRHRSLEYLEAGVVEEDGLHQHVDIAGAWHRAYRYLPLRIVAHLAGI